MKDFSFRDGDKILQNLLSSNNKDDKYILSNHIKIQAKKRKINIDYVGRMLLYNEPLGILSSRKNRFKVFYPSEFHSDTDDLIVIIAIDEDEKIIGVTTFEDVKTHREGLIDDKEF